MSIFHHDLSIRANTKHIERNTQLLSFQIHHLYETRTKSSLRSLQSVEVHQTPCSTRQRPPSFRSQRLSLRRAKTSATRHRAPPVYPSLRLLASRREGLGLNLGRETERETTIGRSFGTNSRRIHHLYLTGFPMFVPGKTTRARRQARQTTGSRTNTLPVHLGKTNAATREPILELESRPQAQIEVLCKMLETVLARLMTRRNGPSRKENGCRTILKRLRLTNPTEQTPPPSLVLIRKLQYLLSLQKETVQ